MLCNFSLNVVKYILYISARLKISFSARRFGSVLLRKRSDITIRYADLPADEETKKASKTGAFVYEWVDSLALALLVLATVFSFLFRPVGVDGTSMVPTLDHGDWLVLKATYTELKHGDIVVVTQPNIFEKPIVKRIIGMGGDVVDIDFEAHTVSVNGEILQEPYISAPTEERKDVEFPLTVPEGKLFLMGDNRNGSTDSRDSRIGCVDERYVLGVASFRLFPLGEWRISDENEAV